MPFIFCDCGSLGPERHARILAGDLEMFRRGVISLDEVKEEFSD